MIKLFKKLATTALILIVIGAIVFGVAFAISGFSFNKLNGITTENVIITESGTTADKLFLKFNTCDINLKFDEQAEKISLNYPVKRTKGGDELNSVSLTESGDKITITETVSLKNQLFIWNFFEPKAEIIIPTDRISELHIEIDTGDVAFDGEANLTVLDIETDTGDVNSKNAVINVLDKLEIEVDTGDIKLGKITAGTLVIETDSGDAELGETNISKTANVSVDTGNVKLKANLRAESLKIETDTGDVDCNDGAVIDSENIGIKTDTGDVEILISGNRTNYETTVRTSTGDSNINSGSGSPRKLTVTTVTGDIEVNYTES